MSDVLYEVKEHIALVTLSRPEALNAINMEMLESLDEIFKKIKEDKNIYTAIITGEGERSFVAGADISEMKDLNGKQAHKFGAYGSSIFRDIEMSRVPVIAAINKGINLDIDSAFALATDYFSKCFVTRDQKRAMEAFMKKEKFKGFENK